MHLSRSSGIAFFAGSRRRRHARGDHCCAGGGSRAAALRAARGASLRWLKQAGRARAQLCNFRSAAGYLLLARTNVDRWRVFFSISGGVVVSSVSAAGGRLA